MADLTMHLGWHFVAIRDGQPYLRDGSPLRLRHTYEHTGKLSMCKAGYHDSARVIDALRYAPGAGLCRVLVSGDLIDTDKRCSRYRRVLAYADVTRELHEFSARIAYCALLAERERGREPDPRSWAAVAVKMRWCRSEASDEDLSAAWSAAGSAAWSAAGAAGAARSAAWSAAWSAAGSAAGAAWSAAGSAAWSAAGAAWSAANALLLSALPRELVEVD